MSSAEPPPQRKSKPKLSKPTTTGNYAQFEQTIVLSGGMSSEQSSPSSSTHTTPDQLTSMTPNLPVGSIIQLTQITKPTVPSSATPAATTTTSTSSNVTTASKSVKAHKSNAQPQQGQAKKPAASKSIKPTTSTESLSRVVDTKPPLTTASSAPVTSVASMEALLNSTMRFNVVNDQNVQSLLSGAIPQTMLSQLRFPSTTVTSTGSTIVPVLASTSSGSGNSNNPTGALLPISSSILNTKNGQIAVLWVPSSGSNKAGIGLNTTGQLSFLPILPTSSTVSSLTVTQQQPLNASIKTEPITTSTTVTQPSTAVSNKNLVKSDNNAQPKVNPNKCIVNIKQEEEESKITKLNQPKDLTTTKEADQKPKPQAAVKREQSYQVVRSSNKVKKSCVDMATQTDPNSSEDTSKMFELDHMQNLLTPPGSSHEEIGSSDLSFSVLLDENDPFMTSTTNNATGSAGTATTTSSLNQTAKTKTCDFLDELMDNGSALVSGNDPNMNTTAIINSDLYLANSRDLLSRSHRRQEELSSLMFPSTIYTRDPGLLSENITSPSSTSASSSFDTQANPLSDSSNSDSLDLSHETSLLEAPSGGVSFSEYTPEFYYGGGTGSEDYTMELLSSLIDNEGLNRDDFPLNDLNLVSRVLHKIETEPNTSTSSRLNQFVTGVKRSIDSISSSLTGSAASCFAAPKLALTKAKRSRANGLKNQSNPLSLAILGAIETTTKSLAKCNNGPHTTPMLSGLLMSPSVGSCTSRQQQHNKTCSSISDQNSLLKSILTSPVIDASCHTSSSTLEQTLNSINQHFNLNSIKGCSGNARPKPKSRSRPKKPSNPTIPTSTCVSSSAPATAADAKPKRVRPPRIRKPPAPKVPKHSEGSTIDVKSLVSNSDPTTSEGSGISISPKSTFSSKKQTITVSISTLNSMPFDSIIPNGSLTLAGSNEN